MSTATFIPVGDIHPASWHQERATGIGGSESAALFNEGYGCNRQLIMEKRGMPADYKHTRATELLFDRGNRMETIVAAAFVEETSLKVRNQPSRRSKTHAHARVNMDRQIVAVDPKHLYKITRDKDGFSPLAEILDNPGPGALECKTMNPFDYRRLLKEGLNKHPHYILQVQHTLAVTGYRWGMFAVLDTTSFELVWFAMLRNEDLIAEILARTDSAWDLVMDTSRDLPARLPDKDPRCTKCLWRRTCRGDAYLEANAGADFATDYVDTQDAELIELANDYVVAAEQEDQASEVTTAIKAKIKQRMTEAQITKVRVPDVIRFCQSSSAGRKGWDGKALDGEVNALNKGEVPALEEIEPDVLTANAGLVAALLKAVSNRIKNCQKTGAPSTSFRSYAA